MITLGTDEENKKFAEEVLTDIWKESLDRSKETEIFPEVKKEVLKILEEIKKGKNAKSFSIEMGSIILRISFKTPREMLSTIHYFESRSFQEAIGNIAEGLGYYFNTAFAVFTVMPIDSLWGILNPQSSLARAQEYGIRLSISVSSPADMLQLRSLIVSEKIAKSTQSISEALSDHFSGKITVKAKADMKELENVYDGENTTTASGNKPKKDIDLLMEDIGYRLLQGAEANTTEKQHNVETLLDKIRDHEVHQVDLGVSASAGEDYDSNIQETTQQMEKSPQKNQKKSKPNSENKMIC